MKTNFITKMDRYGYPFYIRLNGLTSQFISIYGNYCKDIWITYPLIEIKVIRDWRPVGETPTAIELDRRRQEIITKAKNSLEHFGVDDWDEIPF